MTTLKTQWQISLRILLSPIVLITLATTAAAICFASYFSSNTAMVIVFSAIASISAGILGGIAWDQYREISGNSEFLKKGKSAVRNLVLIDDQMNRLRNHLIDMDRRKETLTVNDIDHHLLTTEKNVISAIEDWVDMMPDLRKQAELAQSLSQESDKYKMLLNDKTALENELSKKGANEKDLENKIKQKESELSGVYLEMSRLKTRQLTLGGPTLTTSNIFDSSKSAPLTLGATTLENCKSCGKLYQPTGILSANNCSACMGGYITH